jgi:hypothetical protein
MEDTDFSDDFCAFLQTAIPAVEAAELLLCVAARPDVWWDRAQPGTERYVEPLVAQGLLEMAPDGRFRCRIANDAVAGHVRVLARAYEERPVTLIRMIYALRDNKIKTFAEAFKLRKG